MSNTNPGVQPSTPQEIVNGLGTLSNHIPKYTTGLIGRYKNESFTEYIITIDPNNYVTSEDGDQILANEGAGQLRGQVKKEIIYVKN